MIILGIDPGSRFTGYGVIETSKTGERILEHGVLRLNATDHHQLRLKQIHERLLAVIDRCLPDECAIEMPVYAQNAQALLKLGRAQASAMLAALNRDVPVTEYTPKEVKKSVTGNGNASKEQVNYMVRSILTLDQAEKISLDTSDALAVSICHANRNTTVSRGKYSSWSQFVKTNPGRTS
jgi:crossover junction endodeoxyribonuclease RuvC